MDYVGSIDLFNQAGIDFLLEAQAAAEFAQSRRASMVRLVADVWPDFEIEREGTIEPFEITEADLPGRKRGREYREVNHRIKDDPVENWTKRADQVPAALHLAAARKAEKRYSGRAQLLIYLNISEYGIREKEIENCFSDATATAKDQFDAIWVLWKGQSYPVWNGGERA
jgi:hypothetical protein